MKKIYTCYVRYAKAGNEGARDKEFKTLQDVVAKKDDIIKMMRNSQKKFADANGFKIKD